MARLHLPRCQTLLDAKGCGGERGRSVGIRRLRGVFAALLGFSEVELSMGAGISPRSRYLVV